VLQVSGGPASSRDAPGFDAGRLPRLQVIGENLAKELDRIEKTRYVAGGPAGARAGKP